MVNQTGSGTASKTDGVGVPSLEFDSPAIRHTGSNMKKLKISLDFDGTYTADPELWDAFVQKAKSQGHEVTIVTYRREDMVQNDILGVAERLGIPIIFTAFKAKKKRYNADIWIDDQPELIFD